MTVSLGEMIAIAGVVLSVIGGLVTLSVKLILHRMDRMENDQGQRFDSLDKQMDRTRERLHKMENWISARTSIDDVRELLKQRPPG